MTNEIPTRPAADPVPPPTPPSPLSSPGFRVRSAHWLLGGASACLLLLAVIHAGGYAVAGIAISNSGLKPVYQATFRGLWLGFSLQALVVAAILALAALRPAAISRSVIVLCGLMPLVSGAILASTLESPAASLLLIGASVLVVAGALARPPVPQARG